jgi:hypothetical protein
MREVISQAAGLPASQVDVTVVPILPAGYQQAAGQASRLRSQAADLRRQAAEHYRRAATTLTDAGLSLRDTATIMGISYQRVAQLVEDNNHQSSGHTTT